VNLLWIPPHLIYGKLKLKVHIIRRWNWGLKWEYFLYKVKVRMERWAHKLKGGGCQWNKDWILHMLPNWVFHQHRMSSHRWEWRRLLWWVLVSSMVFSLIQILQHDMIFEFTIKNTHPNLVYGIRNTCCKATKIAGLGQDWNSHLSYVLNLWWPLSLQL